MKYSFVFDWNARYISCTTYLHANLHIKSVKIKFYFFNPRETTVSVIKNYYDTYYYNDCSRTL